LPRLPKSS
jgi:hypothetical protein